MSKAGSVAPVVPDNRQSFRDAPVSADTYESSNATFSLSTPCEGDIQRFTYQRTVSESTVKFLEEDPFSGSANNISRVRKAKVLVLGSKYEFTKLERKRLVKKFSEILYVQYSGKNSPDVLSEITCYMSSCDQMTVVLNTHEKVDNEIIKFLTTLQFEKHIKYISIENFLEKYLHKCYIPSSNDELHFLDDIQPYSLRKYFLKRCIDISGAFFLLCFSWPIMLFCINKIKKQSPGPALYIQKRIGKKNKEFSCIKFRSMGTDAEKDGAQFACEKDPRIFSWGSVMRRTRFDELPQMLNILKGEMHLIGPRPERKHWTVRFEEKIPYYSERHLVAPGVTGWAQVMYPYGASEEDARQKLMYDLYYIKCWSIRLELKIVWMTAITVMKGSGV